jgi:CBS domain-containing protein
LLLVDGDGRPQRWALAGGDGRDDAHGTLDVVALGPRATLRDALDGMVTSTVGRVAVVDDEGRYQGVADMATITRAVDAMRAAARADNDAAHDSDDSAAADGPDGAEAGAGVVA